MAQFDSVLIVSHVVHRDKPPHDVLSGPFTSVKDSLKNKFPSVYTLQLPLVGFNRPVAYGPVDKEIEHNIPKFLGAITPLKYILDLILTKVYLLKYLITISGKKLVIGIDPLSCLPLVLFRKLFGYKLVFYCVDFNTHRFTNPLLQKIYEKADEICSKYSDQTWVVSELLVDYKQKTYGSESLYIPNSSIFIKELYAEGKKKKKGNKLVWGGSILTENQYHILLGLLKQIQREVRPDIEIHLAPTGNIEKFKQLVKEYGLKKTTVHALSKKEWQNFIASCDVGIAIYDTVHGSTWFIEPLKIWDFMMCGMPFIISKEPSLSSPIISAGVAHRLGDHNTLDNIPSLSKFMDEKNIEKLQSKCVKLAEEYDIQKQILKAITLL